MMSHNVYIGRKSVLKSILPICCHDSPVPCFLREGEHGEAWVIRPSSHIVQHVLRRQSRSRLVEHELRRVEEGSSAVCDRVCLGMLDVLVHCVGRIKMKDFMISLRFLCSLRNLFSVLSMNFVRHWVCACG